MLILAIDIGNKNTKLGLFKDKKLIKHKKVPTHHNLPDGSQVLDIKSLLKEFIGKKTPFKAIVSSVVPSINTLFSKVLKVMNIDVFFVDGELKIPGYQDTKILIKLAYKNLGPDRIANLYGAREITTPPFCVIDMGTATTVDIVSKSGEHIGGLIMPGMEMGREALAHLPKIATEDVGGTFLSRYPLIGKSTSECINAGIYWGEVCRIEGIINKIQGQVCRDRSSDLSNVLITGGAGELIAKGLKLPYYPNLTLEGLNIIARKRL